MERSALFIVFFCFFFKVQQTVHKTTFHSGPPSVLNSPGLGAARGHAHAEKINA
jgi:hypothetical protein